VINNIIIDFNIANDDFASDTLDPDTSESSLMKHSPILRELSGNVINDNINPNISIFDGITDIDCDINKNINLNLHNRK